MSDEPEKCPACGLRCEDHLGLIGTCEKLANMRAARDSLIETNHALTAELDAMRNPWRPIDEAPHRVGGEDRFDLWAHGSRCANCRWNPLSTRWERAWITRNGGFGWVEVVGPTHYMRIPSGPLANLGAGERSLLIAVKWRAEFAGEPSGLYLFDTQWQAESKLDGADGEVYRVEIRRVSESQLTPDDAADGAA